ncbi:MAG: hypothetical protein UD936_09205 [Acutalibacteraceae bacterium]|nr:hypothetical protein [Acutalibacteraceae bacterium]
MNNTRGPRKIRQYGEGDSFIPTPPQAYEPPPEVKARYKKFQILTLAAFALLFLLLTQCVLFLTYRVLTPQPLFMQISPLLIEIAIMLIIVAIYRYEQNTSDLFSFSNLIALIIGESVLSVGMFLMYFFEVPWLITFTAIFSIVFAVYILGFVKAGLKFRLAMCAIIALTLFVSDTVSLHSLEFTPRYIYISTGGYHDKLNDENNFYFENNAEESSVDDKRLNEIRDLSETLSTYGWSVQCTDGDDTGNGLEFLNTKFLEKFRYGDFINVDGRYDDEFFKDNSLFISYIQLQHPDDTVELTDYKYATLFGKPYITYNQTDSSATTPANEDERAICIILLEVSKSNEKEILDKMAGFSMKNAVINYR